MLVMILDIHNSPSSTHFQDTKKKKKNKWTYKEEAEDMASIIEVNKPNKKENSKRLLENED